MQSMSVSHSTTVVRRLGVIATLGLALVLAWTCAADAMVAKAHVSKRAHLTPCQKEGLKKHVLRVGSYLGKAGRCTGIQEAVNAARPGDYILIGPGDYKQSTSTHLPGTAYGDGLAAADILVTTPGLHIRGMDRNTVIIDGTKPGSPQCSAAKADQTFGPAEGGNYQGNNGVVVYKASGDWLQNFSTCNFLGSNHGGDAVWFDGGGATGKQQIGSWWGEYLSSTTTYWEGGEKPSDKYGIYASNTYGPGFFQHDYASNMSDSGYYIGACPDCNTILNHVRSEGNDLGYSGSNSGGHITVENSEFDNNEEGFATQSQNNDDAPSPQDGICPGGKTNPSPPAGAQRKNICWALINNRIVNNNNGASPTDPGAPGLVGTGMTLAGSHNDLVVGNTISGNGAWGILVVPYPGVEEEPPPQVLAEFPEDNCKGGTKAVVSGKATCLFEPFANEIMGNKFANNGSFKNPSNGDIGEVANAEPTQLTNCWHGNVAEGGGEPTSEPKAIQTTHGTCSNADAGGEPTSSVLGAEAVCDSQLLATCPPPASVAANYPRSSEVKLVPLPKEESMPEPCEGVPANSWCRKHKKH
jgi:hypothetical protein